MVCLPDTGWWSPTVLVAPLLVARGLGRRAAHWLVIHHQRHLQKLSVRRRHRQSLSNKARSFSEPLVSSSSMEEQECKIRCRSQPITCCLRRPPSPLTPQLDKARPQSEPITCSLHRPPSTLLEDEDDAPAGREAEMHVTGLHLPVQPLVVICSHPEDTCNTGVTQDTVAGAVWQRPSPTTCLFRVSLHSSSSPAGQQEARYLDRHPPCLWLDTTISTIPTFLLLGLHTCGIAVLMILVLCTVWPLPCSHVVPLVSTLHGASPLPPVMVLM